MNGQSNRSPLHICPAFVILLYVRTSVNVNMIMTISRAALTRRVCDAVCGVSRAHARALDCAVDTPRPRHCTAHDTFDSRFSIGAFDSIGRCVPLGHGFGRSRLTSC